MFAMDPTSRRGWSRRTWVVAVPYAATLVLFALANRLTTAANTIFLQSTAPLWLLALSWWLLRERIRGRDLAFMGVLAVGMVCLFVDAAPGTFVRLADTLGAGRAVAAWVGEARVQRTAPDPALGNVLALASGLTWALAVAGLRWLAKGESRSPGQPVNLPRTDGEGEVDGGGQVDRLTTGSNDATRGDGPATDIPTGPADSAADDNGAAAATVAGNVLAFAVCLPFAWPLQGGAASDWAELVFLGVVQVALAYVCLTRGMRRVPAFEASLLLLLEPVLNPVWAWLVHGETLGPWALGGGAVIVTATAVHASAKR